MLLILNSEPDGSNGSDSSNSSELELLKDIQKTLDLINKREEQRDTSQKEIVEGDSNQYTELLSEIKEIKLIQETQLTWNVWFIIFLIAVLVIAYIIKVFKRFI